MQLRVLGEVQVVGADGVVVPLGGLRQRLLLAVLLAEVDEVVGLGHLIEAVWPDGRLPAEPEKTLRTYTARLRRVLDQAGIASTVLTTRDNGYLLAPGPGLYDAAAFAELTASARRLDQPSDVAAELFERALALWDGPAFGDLSSELSLLAEAQHLEELRLVATEDLAAIRLARGDDALVVADLERLVARHPLRERLRRLLMEALSRGGRQGEALRVFEDYRRLLRTELGLDPSADLRALETRLLAADSNPVERESPHRNVRGYKLFERIGEGAFSVVYRGKQPDVGRDVAVKIIRAELANRPEFIRRFEAEAQLVARLEHPNIVPLYDYWREPSRAYLVMRWLRGGSLEAQLDRGPWSVERTARMLRDIGPALASAHRAGVVHRDVRPANILLDDDGNAYLSDFGIAVAATDDFTAAGGHSPGSPAYAPPEQLRGGAIGPQADVYALGITIFEALAGRLPFANATDGAMLWSKQLHEPIPQLTSLRPDLPVGIDAVLATATAKSASDRHQTVDALVESFCEHMASTPPSAARPARPEAAPNPYRGLLAFHEADANFFFGRQQLIDELVEHLRQPRPTGRFLGVIGASGSGKSSVVRAGLIPALRRGAIPGAQRWFVVDFVPGTDPFNELANALLRVMAARPADLRALLSSGDNGIALAAQAVLPDDGSELVLVIDQFEELFTFCEDGAVRNRFLEGLAVAVGDEASRVRVVVTLRADFLEHPLRHPGFAQLLKTGAVMVTPLTAGELEQAVVDPARRVGVTFQPGLVAEIVADVANRPAALPLLQFALHELYSRQVGGELTTASYRDIGGVSGALADRSEQLVGGIAAVAPDSARRLFGRLVTLGEGVEDTRRRALRSELDDGSRGSEIGEMIDRFGAARLLSFDRDPLTRSPTVEIAHEALLHQWPRLAGWISADRAGLRLLRQIADAAAGWDARERDAAELYRGGRLDDALEWQADHAGDLNEREAAFLAAGRAQRDAARVAELDRLEAQKRSNRRLRVLLVGVAGIAVVALLAGAVAVQQRARASRNSRVASARSQAAVLAQRTSETRRLGLEATGRAKDSPQLSLLLAVEAHRREPGPESLGALQRALTGTGNFLGVAAAGRKTNRVYWLDDRRLAVAGADGVFVQDLVTGKVTVDYPDLAVVSRGVDTKDATPAVAPLAAFSSTRAAVTVEKAPNEVRVVRLDRVSATPVRLSHDDPVQSIAISPDGAVVATADTLGRVRLFDSASGQLRWSALSDPELVNGQLELPAGVAPSAHNSWQQCDCIGLGQHVVGFTPDGTTVVSVHGPVLRQWDRSTGRFARPERILVDATDRGDSAWADSFHLDVDAASRLVVSGRARTGVFDLVSGAEIGKATSIAPADSTGGPWVSDVAWLDPNTTIALSSGGQIVRRRVPDQQTVGVALDIRLNDPVDLAVSPKHDRVAVASSEGVGFWSLRGDRLLARAAPRRGATVGSLSPDGTTLTAFQGDGLLHAPRPTVHTDLAGPIPIAKPVPSVNQIYRYFDRSRLLYSVSALGKVTSWDPTSGAQIATYDVRYTWTSVAVSADGAWIAFGVPGLRIYDTRSGTQVALFTAVGGAVRSLSFSPDRTRVAVAQIGSKLTTVFDTATQQLVGHIDPGGPQIIAVRYSPDGTTLATVDLTGRITVRDPVTFAAGRTLVGSNEGSVSDSPLWFSADSRYLLSGSARQAQLWDLAAGVQVGDPFPNDAGFKLDGVDGPHLLTAVDDHLLLWNLDVAQWPTIACRAAGRNLTAEEWSRFGPADQPYAATCPQWPALG